MDSQLAQLGFEREDSGLSGLEIWRNGEGVVALALNQAPVNSLSMELLGTLQVALNRISAAGPRALILTSKLSRVFSAGLDLQALHAPSEADFCQFWQRFEDVWRSLFLFPFTTVAAVHGAAPAGGTVLTLSCDYRIATPDTKMGLNETAIGMVPPAWLIAMADRVLGPVNAERAVSSGRIWRASSALELGYLDELVQVDSLLERAVEKALEMSQGHTAARAETKRLQRASVVDLAGPESVSIMWERVSSAPFQAAVSSVIESLKKR